MRRLLRRRGLRRHRDRRRRQHPDPGRDHRRQRGPPLPLHLLQARGRARDESGRCARQPGRDLRVRHQCFHGLLQGRGEDAGGVDRGRMVQDGRHWCVGKVKARRFSERISSVVL